MSKEVVAALILAVGAILAAAISSCPATPTRGSPPPPIPAERVPFEGLPTHSLNFHVNLLILSADIPQRIGDRDLVVQAGPIVEEPSQGGGMGSSLRFVTVKNGAGHPLLFSMDVPIGGGFELKKDAVTGCAVRLDTLYSPHLLAEDKFAILIGLDDIPGDKCKIGFVNH